MVDFCANAQLAGLLSTVTKKRKLHPVAHGLDLIIDALRQQDAGASTEGVQALLELVRAHHRDVNAAVSKLGRGIDKAMTAQLNLPLEKLSSRLLVEAVHRHLVSDGAFDAAALLRGSNRGAAEIALHDMHAVLVALQAGGSGGAEGLGRGGYRGV